MLSSFVLAVSLSPRHHQLGLTYNPQFIFQTQVREHETATDMIGATSSICLPTRSTLKVKTCPNSTASNCMGDHGFCYDLSTTVKALLNLVSNHESA